MLSTNETPTKNYRVSLSWIREDFGYDPGKIQHANDAIVLDNLYLNLIDQTDDGRFVSVAADEFAWKGAELRFRFSGRTLTNKGNPITAQDAAASLKRLLILNQNSHGLLSRYLCQRTPLESLNDSCESIFVEGNELVIQPNPEIDKEVILSLLSGVDFKVLPKRVFLPNAPFKITDYSETTGAYFLSGFTSAPQFESNPNFYDYRNMAIHRWKLVELPWIVSEDEVGQSADIITTSHIAYRGLLNSKNSKFEKEAKSTAYFAMTRVGLSSFKFEERAYVAQLLREAYRDFLDHKFEENYSLFGPKSVSALPIDWETSQAHRLNSTALPPKKKFRVSAPLGSEPMRKLVASVAARNPNIEFVPIEFNEKRYQSENYDAIYSMIDTSYIESVSYLEYGIRFGIFGIDASDGEALIAKAIRSPRSVRQETLAKFHQTILEQGNVFPLASRKYEILSTPDLDWSLSKKSIATTSLWKARKAGWF